MLPAAEEAESIWTNKFGFNKFTQDEVRVSSHVLFGSISFFRINEFNVFHFSCCSSISSRNITIWLSSKGHQCCRRQSQHVNYWYEGGGLPGFFFGEWRSHYFAEPFPLRCIGSFCLLVYRK